MHIELHSVVGRKDGVMWTPVDREAVILAENHYVALDDGGRRIWDLLEQPQRVDRLCQRLGTSTWSALRTVVSRCAMTTMVMANPVTWD